ncbi:Uncharacterised protein [Mycobacteroides abscessus subsp. abscessus]|nr:Uncharacterised protein [Mycobacteroides abscessus subsp. abscessus]
MHSATRIDTAKEIGATARAGFENGSSESAPCTTGLSRITAVESTRPVTMPASTARAVMRRQYSVNRRAGRLAQAAMDMPSEARKATFWRCAANAMPTPTRQVATVAIRAARCWAAAETAPLRSTWA